MTHDQFLYLLLIVFPLTLVIIIGISKVITEIRFSCKHDYYFLRLEPSYEVKHCTGYIPVNTELDHYAVHVCQKCGDIDRGLVKGRETKVCQIK